MRPVQTDTTIRQAARWPNGMRSATGWPPQLPAEDPPKANHQRPRASETQRAAAERRRQAARRRLDPPHFSCTRGDCRGHARPDSRGVCFPRAVPRERVPAAGPNVLSRAVPDAAAVRREHSTKWLACASLQISAVGTGQDRRLPAQDTHSLRDAGRLIMNRSAQRDAGIRGPLPQRASRLAAVPCVPRLSNRQLSTHLFPMAAMPVTNTPRTMFEKIWHAHVVEAEPGKQTILYIDLHLVHEVTMPRRCRVAAGRAQSAAAGADAGHARSQRAHDRSPPADRRSDFAAADRDAVHQLPAVRDSNL